MPSLQAKPPAPLYLRCHDGKHGEHESPPQPTQRSEGVLGHLAARLVTWFLHDSMPLLRNMRMGFVARHTFRVNGTVIDAAHRKPIDGARIVVETQPQQACQSGYDGAFAGVAVRSQGQLVSLSVSAPGFRPATFKIRAGAPGCCSKLTLALWPQDTSA